MCGRAPSAFSLVAGLVVVTACAEDAGVADTVTVTDSAGVTIYTSSGDGWDRPLDVVFAAEPHLRIGSVAGGEETQLTYVQAAMRLSDGRLLVAERGDQRLRLFGEEGEFLNWIGHVGEGPAEFASVGGAGLLAGDTVWVFDIGLRELELFTPEGRFVRTFRPERLPEVRTFRRTGMIPDGRVTYIGTTLDLSPSGDPSQDFTEEVVVSVADREGRGPVAVTSGEGATYSFPSPGTFTAMFDERFSSRPSFAFATDRIYRAHPGPFEIREISYEGDLLRVTRVERPRVPVTAAFIGEYERASDEAYAELQRRRGLPATPRETPPAPYADSLPHFGSTLVDAQDRLWVREYVGHTQADPSRWWRIGREGGVDGYLDLPERFTLLAIDAEEAIGAELGELDVPYVVAYRLIPRPS
jgi:hypothetical protein